MRGVLINANTQSVTEIELDGNDFRAIQKAIGASPFDIRPVGEDNVVYFDDEFLLRDGADELQSYVWIEGLPDPLGGKCLILGNGPDGSSVDTTLSVAEIEALIKGYQDMKLVGWTHTESEKDGDFTIIRGPRPIFEPKPLYDFVMRTGSAIRADEAAIKEAQRKQIEEFIRLMMEK